jgi:membrane fusion protein (multidrug efflux system)
MSCAVLALALAACGSKQDAAPQQRPAPKVGVLTVALDSVQLSTELPGRLESSRVAEVRARVTGVVQKRVFAEGSDVKAGQVLYRIDAAPYEAALQSAQAQLAQAQAQQADARAKANRYKPLVAANAVSQQEYDAAIASEKAADAQVAAGKAAVRAARINLDYTSITAPISGRIGRSLVTEGALVSQAEATHLATIQQTDLLYLNISQSASEVLQLREALQSGAIERAGKGEAANVTVLLEDGSEYDQAARLLFTDLSVDPGTGQVSLRAEVPNPKGLLLPGMYVRARVHQAKLDNVVLLPQQAVTRGGAQGDSVTVVAADGSIQSRAVKVGPMHGQDWIILEGLQPGEKVMVDGFMKLMPGVGKVTPVPYAPQGAAESASAEPATSASAN